MYDSLVLFYLMRGVRNPLGRFVLFCYYGGTEMSFLRHLKCLFVFFAREEEEEVGNELTSVQCTMHEEMDTTDWLIESN